MMKPVPAHTKRLAHLINQPGGITVHEAVTAAEERIEGLRERGLSNISETIRSMQALAGTVQPDAKNLVAHELYTMSNTLIGIAGVFGKSGVGEVARSLCVLIERMLLIRHWDRGAVQAHLDSLRLMSQDGVTAAEMATIGAALRQVVNRLQPPR